MKRGLSTIIIIAIVAGTVIILGASSYAIYRVYAPATIPASPTTHLITTSTVLTSTPSTISAVQTTKQGMASTTAVSSKTQWPAVRLEKEGVLYENQDHGYSLKYPQGYQVVTSPELLPSKYTDFAVYSPERLADLKSKKGIPYPNFFLMYVDSVKDLPKNTTGTSSLEEYLENRRREVSYGAMFKRTTMFKGLTAYEALNLDFDLLPSDVVRDYIYVEHNGHVYIFIGDTLVNIDERQNDANAMISTFKFTK